MSAGVRAYKSPGPLVRALPQPANVMAERTTVIQYRNKTVTNIHSHDHDHVHINGPGDRASLLIAVVVVIGVLIGVVVVACLVSILGQKGIHSEI